MPPSNGKVKPISCEASNGNFCIPRIFQVVVMSYTLLEQRFVVAERNIKKYTVPMYRTDVPIGNVVVINI